MSKICIVCPDLRAAKNIRNRLPALLADHTLEFCGLDEVMNIDYEDQRVFRIKGNEDPAKLAVRIESVLGTSGDNPGELVFDPSECPMILISSVKGGAGKSSIARMLCRIIETLQDKKVLYVDFSRISDSCINDAVFDYIEYKSVDLAHLNSSGEFECNQLSSLKFETLKGLLFYICSSGLYDCCVLDVPLDYANFSLLSGLCEEAVFIEKDESCAEMRELVQSLVLSGNTRFFRPSFDENYSFCDIYSQLGGEVKDFAYEKLSL